MSTFYLLPPRPALGARFADYLESLFPGLDWPSETWADLADTLIDTLRQRPDVFVVYGEEVHERADLAETLVKGFGAEAGDEIIELRPGTRPGELHNRSWRLGGEG